MRTLPNRSQPRSTALIVRRLRRVWRLWFEGVRSGDYLSLLLTAAFVGAMGGLGTIAFEAGIHAVQEVFWQAVEPRFEILREIPVWKRLLIPTLGGLAAGWITLRWAAPAKGNGVGEVIRSIALRDGTLPLRTTLAKSVASILTIGSGGSSGRAGPIVQISAALAARMGQWLGMSRKRLRTLVGCGAAAGIAATFNAPIAGALFANEVVLREFGATQFGPVVVSSVIATVAARSLRGDLPVFSPPACTFAASIELLPYALLGVICGLASFAYIRINRATEVFFERRARLPVWIRPALGGLLLGLLALALPQVFGDGHWLANYAFAGRFPVHVLLALVFAKMLATALTLGSGGGGGVFSPVLSIGALLGAGFGGLAAPLLGESFGGIAAYSLVGMAGLVAGSMLAPITAILMVFEITSNYDIILPVMLVSILATVVAARLNGNLSIYTTRLAHDGIRLARGGSPDLLLSRRVAEHLRPGPEMLPPDAPAQELLDRLLSSAAPQIHVVDSGGVLLGTLALSDTRRVRLSSPGRLDGLLARDIMRVRPPVVTAGESLSSALAKFANTHLAELPVVDSLETRRLSGTLAYTDVLAAYQEEMLHTDAPQALSGGLSALGGHPIAIAPGFELAEWEPPARFHGQTLAEARLPDALGLRVLLVKRQTPGGGPHTLLPNARTVLGPADTLVLMGSAEAIARAMEM